MHPHIYVLHLIEECFCSPLYSLFAFFMKNRESFAYHFYLQVKILNIFTGLHFPLFHILKQTQHSLSITSFLSYQFILVIFMLSFKYACYRHSSLIFTIKLSISIWSKYTNIAMATTVSTFFHIFFVPSLILYRKVFE